MYIVSRDKKTIVNTEQVASIYLEDDSILVNNADYDHFIFAYYEDKREAENDFIKIMVNLGSGCKCLKLGGKDDYI